MSKKIILKEWKRRKRKMDNYNRRKDEENKIDI